MTARDQARLSERRLGERGRGRAFRPEPQPSVGELLVAARERKGVDLATAEADTRIRARFLEALERGEFDELPGHVYTKGFLRNYAAYLGLDPDALVVRWKEEVGAVHPTHEQVVIRPRRSTVPHPALAFGRAALVVGVLLVAVVAFASYIGLQLLQGAGAPSLGVDQPPVTEVRPNTESFVLSGTSSPNSTIAITTGAGVMRVASGDDGTWTREVPLAEGRNDFEIVATDPDSGRTSQPVRLIVQVPVGQGPEAPTLTVTSPNDGTEFANGAIPIEGTTNGSHVSVTARLEAPPPDGPTPGPSAPPEAKEIAVDAAGAFSGSYQLAPGTWTLTITASGPQEKTATETRTVTVTFTGVNVVVEVRNTRAWLRVWVDGKLSPEARGVILEPGGSLEFTGRESVEVRTGSSGSTFFTVNGTALGALGPSGQPETWLFAPPDPPTRTSRTN